MTEDSIKTTDKAAPQVPLSSNTLQSSIIGEPVSGLSQTNRTFNRVNLNSKENIISTIPQGYDLATDTSTTSTTTTNKIISGIKQGIMIGESQEDFTVRVTSFLTSLLCGYVIGSYITGNEFKKDALINDEIDSYQQARNRMPVTVKYFIPKGTR